MTVPVMALLTDTERHLVQRLQVGVLQHTAREASFIRTSDYRTPLDNLWVLLLVAEQVGIVPVLPATTSTSQLSQAIHDVIAFAAHNSDSAPLQHYLRHIESTELMALIVELSQRTSGNLVEMQQYLERIPLEISSIIDTVPGRFMIVRTGPVEQGGQK